MDVDGLPIIGPGVDYTQVGAIHQKRTLAFINHFISNTVSFLNKFARSCEQRLEKFNARIEKLDASLSILEAKLSSISGLENVESAGQPMQAEKPPETEIKSSVPQESENKETHEESNPQPMETESGPKASQDPRFAKFFRMIHVGVPIQAVRLKMQAEGFDPSVLESTSLITSCQEWIVNSTK
ncbi:WASH complex subunit 3 isoform X2 [Anabrus simplex]|uniref:WASH complex subunit 3 isoform X2 n=1 Tax=Anabrus simplex TaxID=316456 RepID=UPI0035A3652C